MKKVSIVGCNTYDIDLITEKIEQQFFALSLLNLINNEKKIVIKPNLLMSRAPDAATTTHPEVIGAVIRVLKKHGAQHITIAESSGGIYSEKFMAGIYNTTGTMAVATREGAEIESNYGYREVKVDNGTMLRSINIINEIADADLIINIGKLKTHGMTVFTGCSKNIFGCVPGLMKPELHARFPQAESFGNMLVDISENVAPEINILDGIVGMEGNGPSGGSPRNVGVIIVSNNCYAADLLALEIIGVNVQDVCNLSAAINRKLIVREDIEVFGDDIEQFKISDYKLPESQHSVDMSHKLPKFMRGAVKKLTTPRPVVRTKDCIGCGKCAESCPRHIIDINKTKNGKKAKINPEKCIKCYCCHEMCPPKAIDIKRLSVFNR